MLVSTDHLVRVLDFGLASPTAEDSSTGGTYAYLAPEVWQGQPYTAAADLYAVGVIAFEIFARQHPFMHPNRFMVNPFEATEPDLSLLGVQSGIAQLIGRLLLPDPAYRYRETEQVLADIRAALGLAVLSESEAIRESFIQAAGFVGRVTELTTLQQALAQAQQGHGSAWLIAGESGIGKSRLLSEFRIQALVEDVLVLEGQETQAGGNRPLQVWREPLRRLILTSAVDDLAAGVLQAVIPDIGTLLGREVQGVPTLDGIGEQERLLHAIVQLFQQQTRPMLLDFGRFTVDDGEFGGVEAVDAGGGTVTFVDCGQLP